MCVTFLSLLSGPAHFILPGISTGVIHLLLHSFLLRLHCMESYGNPFAHVTLKKLYSDLDELIAASPVNSNAAQAFVTHADIALPTQEPLLAVAPEKWIVTIHSLKMMAFSQLPYQSYHPEKSIAGLPHITSVVEIEKVPAETGNLKTECTLYVLYTPPFQPLIEEESTTFLDAPSQLYSSPHSLNLECFLWHDKTDGKNFAKVAWMDICTPKEEGGLLASLWPLMERLSNRLTNLLGLLFKGKYHWPIEFALPLDDIKQNMPSFTAASLHVHRIRRALLFSLVKRCKLNYDPTVIFPCCIFHSEIRPMSQKLWN
ncbi:hypothetical protein Nepgr_027518 [Nepenthes gracilis]|uniref:Uncharacterized protein n=1 Tax=Nepenthes gracilis TaxID=150966 RepID=A0AAD3T9Z8_NEPGR|nr:hypothetical protein Nepgr_027518 [Nepenthes gracilis]